MLDLRVVDDADMRALGGKLAFLARAGDVIALEGGLGAGKTTLARGLLSALGLEEDAPSPSFALVQPYEPPLVTLPVAHVDLYRLDDDADVRELGLEDYLTDSVLIIEWPERLGIRLWDHSLILSIEVEADGTRSLTAQVPDAWRDRWPPK
ncbi:tRNA (adenosine(37)-N6)-threonylcarbamoyltransferase complex ATPase subunit type 1 TsaE [Sphingobium sp. SCG-1]|uniref:tRNA (adenosine(37)-N6)-threonylcarbamoyltransferase complex ATPase subunit type 1 TsaE n=1 Tax=Sphingobium sp. SCG-1 TaxID=2072936 RepID=UPI000CD67F4F|nr:tRNA (adenosine(37)-N6)-threonylcarbamoyltransferase complex ATPase subunit type 1 TsaE [Sphingobium sp. SCG-1]AUW58498.1 tRNA (adenosine(37)-N6)-threonylcarbamoyltransferase complex ATPase subunit type 1 TsaE [Sphingobium sp. SCG-1]